MKNGSSIFIAVLLLCFTLRTYAQVISLPTEWLFKPGDSAVYNEKLNVIEAAYPHIFQSYDETTRVKPFLKNLKLLTDETPVSIIIMDNTHIIEVKYKSFIVRYFAPFITGEKIFYGAELYGRDNENYKGAVPMVGYGAGAYILAICDFYGK